MPLVRDGSVDEAVLRYMNRLSDFLFVAGRYAAMRDERAVRLYRSLTGGMRAIAAAAAAGGADGAAAG